MEKDWDEPNPTSVIVGPPEGTKVVVMAPGDESMIVVPPEGTIKVVVMPTGKMSIIVDPPAGGVLDVMNTVLVV